MAFFRPAILDSFAGYSRQQLSSDVLAGITVGVIALRSGLYDKMSTESFCHDLATGLQKVRNAFLKPY